MSDPSNLVISVHSPAHAYNLTMEGVRDKRISGGLPDAGKIGVPGPGKEPAWRKQYTG